MKKILSHDALIFTIRLLLAVLALGAMFGVYDNREFITRFPFLILALIDGAFAGLFLYGFIRFRTLSNKAHMLLSHSVLAYTIYTFTVSMTSLWLYIENLGAENIATAFNMSVPMYITQQIIYLGLAPSAALICVWWLMRKAQ